MRLFLLFVLLTMSACSTNSIKKSQSKPMGKIDICLNQVDSNEYITSHFSKTLEEDVNKIDPSGASVLISLAINGRLSKKINARDISSFVLKKTNGAFMMNFLDMKRVIEELGYKVTGYNHTIIPEMRNSKKIMAISADFNRSLLLITGIDDGVVYMLYPNGMVCLWDFDTFRKEFIPHAILLISP